MIQDYEYTPETLGKVTKWVTALRRSILASIDESGADPVSEQNFLLGLTALSQAEHFFMLAKLTQTRGIYK